MKLDEIEALKYVRQILDEKLKESYNVLAEHQYSSSFEDAQTRNTADFFSRFGYGIVHLEKDGFVPETLEYRLIAKLDSDLIPAVRELFKGLFKASCADQEFEYDMSDIPGADEKNRIRNLCETMKNNGWLEYSYDASSSILKGLPKFPKEERSFFNGTWAECYFRFLIRKLLHDNPGVGYKIFWNVELKALDSDSESGNDMQLDMVIEYNNFFLIFEIKSLFDRYPGKWAKRVNLFESGNSHFITCNVSEYNDKLDFAPFKVFYLSDLEEKLPLLLKKHQG